MGKKEVQAMKASFVELRTKSSEVIRALRRNETVNVFYRGKAVGVMHPVAGNTERATPGASEQEAFGLWRDRDDLRDPAAAVRELRRGRFDDR